MADFYTINITDQAQEQLREIVHYISVQLQTPETALLGQLTLIISPRP